MPAWLSFRLLKGSSPAGLRLSELRCRASGPGDGSRRGARSARAIQRSHLPVRKHHHGGSCGWVGGRGGGPATCLISPPFSRCPCYLFRTKSIINFIYHVSSCCVIDYAIDAVLLYLAFSRKQENARLASHVHSRRRVSCFPCSSVGSGVVTRPNLGPQSGTLRAGRFWCHKELKIRERHTASHRFHVGPSWAARSSSEIQ